MENAQNGTETILKGAEGETIPKKNKNTAELKCVCDDVLRAYSPRKIMWGVLVRVPRRVP